ncbi:transmembrane protein 249 [Protobothrops mucrosquamatus]|uniref:transmembrane protein 249 n=1 Tax=Protobothrops mucrosquamatus TaxID=103944 RepID=UPI000775BA39|nr:transmembrane protein 249 [Protobothrops mucrosquamatus]
MAVFASNEASLAELPIDFFNSQSSAFKVQFSLLNGKKRNVFEETWTQRAKGLTRALPFQAYQDLSAFFIFSMVSGLWLVISNFCKRRLIINHTRDVYQFYIRGILWHEGPLHQIYVRTVSQRDAYGKLFYSLIINGYRLEVLTLVRLTKNYELVDTLGRRIARYLNLNYFEYEDLSMLHVVRHFPPEIDEDEDEDMSIV